MLSGKDYARAIRALIMLKACLQACMMAEIYGIPMLNEEGESFDWQMLEVPILSCFDEALHSKYCNEDI